MKKSIEISVGTVFSVRGEKDRTHIIINTGENNWFSSSACNLKEGGFSIVASPGTAGPENIQEVVNQFSAEMARKGMIEYWIKMTGKPLDEEFMSIINKEMSSQPRRINLD
ncbi:hypothetical protein KKB83_00290 [Patescibacteria group bacterium]|nr:hypothetical protein [Patescibacteria group bacterium]